MHAGLVVAFLVASQAAPIRVAVMPLQPGEGVTETVARTLTSQVVGECRRQKGVAVIAQDEIAQVLSLDQQRQLLGCGDNDRCRVEFGGALGVDRMVIGTLARLGESWLLHVKLMDVKNVKVLREVDRRQKGGSVDDLLDALPGMVTALFSDEKRAADAPVSQGGSAPVAAAEKVVNTVDEPMDKKDLPAKMKVATDGKGLFIAYEDGWGADLPLYVSTDGKVFTAVRVFGRGRDGDSFSMSFWEPRAPAPWQASFGLKKGGGLELHCGEQPIPFTALAEKEEARVLGAATFLKPRWRRIPHALARDDNGTYHLVDGKRGAQGREDLRLYVGRKNNMVRVAVEDVLQERAEDVLLTPTGKLKVEYGERKAAWMEGGVVTPLKFLPVEDNARLIYLELSAYKGQPLHTPCDGRW